MEDVFNILGDKRANVTKIENSRPTTRTSKVVAIQQMPATVVSKGEESRNRREVWDLFNVYFEFVYSPRVPCFCKENSANLPKTEARSLAEFKCCRCSLVNTIPQCHDDNFRPDTLFNSGVVNLKRVPKNSRNPLAENLIPKINDICETP